MLGTLFSHFGTPVAFIAEDAESYAVARLGKMNKVVYVYKTALSPLTLEEASLLFPNLNGIVFNDSDATHQHVFAERQLIEFKNGKFGGTVSLMFYRKNGGATQVFRIEGECICDIMQGKCEHLRVPRSHYGNYVLKATLGATL